MVKARKMLWAALFGIVVLTVFSLTGCTGAQGQGAQPATTPTPPPTQQGLPDWAVTMAAPPGGPLAAGIAGTQQGCYDILQRMDGTADLMYYDYATMQKVYLASSPNLGHDPASTAYLEDYAGGVGVVTAGPYLYVMKNGSYTAFNATGDETMIPYYLRMNLDGSQRKKFVIPPQYEINPYGNIATDGEDLFFKVDVVNRELHTEHTELAKMEFDAQKLTPFYVEEEGVGVDIVGTCSKGLILERRRQNGTTKETQLLLYNPALSEPMQLTEWQSKMTSEAYANDRIYYLQQGSEALYARDILTGNVQTVAQNFNCNGAKVKRAFIAGAVYDNHILISLEDEQTDESYVTVDLDTGAVQQMTLFSDENGKHNSVQIYSEFADGFMVYLGETGVPATDYAPDGTPYETTLWIHHFVRISKQDYWANRPNYLEFDDLVLKDYLRNG